MTTYPDRPEPKKGWGKDFEARVAERLLPLKCQVLKIPDSHAGLTVEGAPKASTKNPYDFQVWLHPFDRRDLIAGGDLRMDVSYGVDGDPYFLYALECKTTNKARFPFGMIRDHQELGLSSFRGTAAGFVVELRFYREAFFVPIGTVLGWAKKSMNRKALWTHAVNLPLDMRPSERKPRYDMSPIFRGDKPSSAQGGLFGSTP